MGHSSKSSLQFAESEKSPVLEQHAEIYTAPVQIDSFSEYPCTLEKGVPHVPELEQTLLYIDKMLKIVKEARGVDFSKNFIHLSTPRPSLLQKIATEVPRIFGDKRNAPIGRRVDETLHGNGLVAPVVITNAHSNDHKIHNHILNTEGLEPKKMAVVILDRHRDIVTRTGSIDTELRACAASAFAKQGFGQVDIIGSDGSVENSTNQAAIEQGLLQVAAENGVSGVPVATLIRIYDALDALQDRAKMLILTEQFDQAEALQAIFRNDLWMAKDSSFKSLMSQWHELQAQKHHHIGIHPNRPGTNYIDLARKLLQKYQDQGLEAVLLSVDIDVLDLWQEKITATLYSPYATIATLLNLDHKEIEAEARAIFGIKDKNTQASESLRFIVTMMYTLQGAFDDYMSSEYKQTIVDLKCMARKILPAGTDVQIQSTPAYFNGVPTSEVVQFIRALKELAPRYGISFGITRKNGVPFYGTVTEVALNIPDYYGNTLKSVQDIVEAMAS